MLFSASASILLGKMPTRLKNIYMISNKTKQFINVKSSLIFRNRAHFNKENTIFVVPNPSISLLHTSKNYFSTSAGVCSNNSIENSENAQLAYTNGFLKFLLYLPGRRQRCEFTLKPINDTIKDLVDFIKLEDKSIEKVEFNNQNGDRISQNTSIGLLVTEPFVIKINDSIYNLEPPQTLRKVNGDDDLNNKAKNDLEEVKKLVSKLYLHLNVEQFESEREDKLIKQLELIKNELEPMEKTRKLLELNAKKHTNRMVWLGLGLMGVQVGIMARLTWFDYSWDIVEPISYFVSYSAVIGVYAYYVLTRKEYDYESASDRIFLRHLHKNAVKQNLNINRYNDLKNMVFLLEADLKKIKESQLKSLSKLSDLNGSSSNLENDINLK